MSALSIQPTYPIFTDIDGQPLEDGFVWIGQANLDPQVNPINVFWDAALTIPAGQPIRTLGGYPSNSGTPARLYVNSDYSIRVMNKNGSVVYSAPAATERYNDVVISQVNAEDVIYDPPFTDSVQTNVEAKLAQTVSVKDFGAVGDGVTDDTAAFANSFATGKAVYAPAATYLLNYLQVPSNTYLFGDGASTIIKPFTPDVRCALGAESGSASTYIENITIRDVQFLGAVATQGFSEQKHLTSFNGVRNLLIENCHFVGFRGDGIYLGSGDAGGATERHNINVAVRGCLFDGVNKDNRNAISIIDGDDVIVEDCYFTRTTRSNMPGAIDIEPNANTFHVVQNIKILNNKFFDIGGGAGAIAFVFQEQAYTTPPSNFLVSGNTIDTCAFAGIYWQYNITGGVTDSYASNNIVVSENVTKNTTFPFIFINAKTLTIENNTFETSSQGARLSTLLANQNIIDVLVQNNLFVDCATASGGGLGILPATRVSVLNNEFNDCGNGTNGGAIQFNSGTSSSVTIAGNNFVTPTGKTIYAIRKEAGHTFTPATNAFFNNRLNGLSNTFEWLPNEAAVPSITAQGTAWTPTVYGATSAGTATYSVQTGFYTKIGRTVFFSLECNWTGHTGTGQVYVSLPENTSATEMSAFTTANCFLYAVTLAAGAQPYALINKNPANRLQLYTLNAGTLASLSVPASGSLVISGSYTSET
jgi:hypothetical protein